MSAMGGLNSQRLVGPRENEKADKEGGERLQEWENWQMRN